MSVLNYILTLVVLIGIFIIVFMVFDKIAFGQNISAPPAVTPTPVQSPTPTTPVPNLQYLPQKSYIQTFVPESGVPTALPATSIPQYGQPQQSSALPTDLMSILSVLFGAGSIGYAKLIGNKTNKVEGLAKDGLSVSSTQSDQIEQIAKKLFETMGAEKANAINDAPAIKLENLNKTKQEITEKAAKS